MGLKIRNDKGKQKSAMMKYWQILKNQNFVDPPNTHLLLAVELVQEIGKMAGQHYRWCQGVHLPVPAAVRGTTEGECSLISKHIHHELARSNPQFHFLNVLVPTGFVLVGQK